MGCLIDLFLKNGRRSDRIKKEKRKVQGSFRLIQPSLSDPYVSNIDLFLAAFAALAPPVRLSLVACGVIAIDGAPKVQEGGRAVQVG